MNMKQPITMRIRDLGLAAALVSSDCELRGTSRDISGRVYFIFAQTKRLDGVVNSYWADTLNVRARRFYDNTKMLKSTIYAEE